MHKLHYRCTYEIVASLETFQWNLYEEVLTESTKFFKDGGLYVRLDLANKETRSYGLL